MKITSPVMRYHGGKFRMAEWVISHFPAHHCYVEPFGGAASVLMRKERSYAEVYNDLDSEIVNVFRVLRDKDQARDLANLMALTPYSREEFQLSFVESDNPIEQARRTIYRAQSGFGSAGATKGSTGFRIDSQREYGLSSHLWAEYPAIIHAFVDRLQGVIIENRPALDVMQQHDTPATLHYVDPPYIPETRYAACMGGRTYRHEMTEEDHTQLLSTLCSLQGFVALSGYDSDLYNDSLKGWVKHQKTSRIAAHRGTKQRIECLWLNPKCANQQPQKTLFSESKVTA